MSLGKVVIMIRISVKQQTDCKILMRMSTLRMMSIGVKMTRF